MAQTIGALSRYGSYVLLGRRLVARWLSWVLRSAAAVRAGRERSTSIRVGWTVRVRCHADAGYPAQAQLTRPLVNFGVRRPVTGGSGNAALRPRPLALDLGVTPASRNTPRPVCRA